MTGLIHPRANAGRNWLALSMAAGLTAALAIPVFADAGAALPPGPKENLISWSGGDIAALRALLAKTGSAADFEAELGDVAEEAGRTALADYLALNAPLEISGDDVELAVLALPFDGKELFVQSCLSCHGGDRYFLQQSKSADEWMGIFDAPYHRRLFTEGVERETFAAYAAATTPLVLDAVPEEFSDERSE